MAITINTNVSSLIAQGSLNKITNALQVAMTQLSTGLKINSAGDDAAGLMISQNMNIQIRGSQKAMANVQDIQNFAAVAEGGMESITEHLQRINELLIQGANDSNSENARTALLVEIQQRLADIDVIAQATSFNGRTMLDGTYGENGESFVVQIGPYADELASVPLNTLDITKAFTNCRLSAITSGTTISGTTYNGIILPDVLNPDSTSYNPTGDNFRAYVDTIQKAIDEITASRGLLGGYLNRIDTTYNNLTMMVENLTSAKSRITDTDIAQASSEMIKQQILQESTATILSQANQLPNLALSLL